MHLQYFFFFNWVYVQKIGPLKTEKIFPIPTVLQML